MSEENPDYAADDDGEKAFTQSDSHTLGDLDLQPYTPAREVAAQAAGLKFPHISANDREQFDATGIYPGATRDVCLVLFLCSLTDKEEIRAALRRPADSLDKAIEWGATRGFTNTNSDTFWAAYGKFIQIVGEAQEAAAKPAPLSSGSNGGGPDPKT